MSNPFLGEIRMGGWNFAPRGFAYCNGQLLAIAGNDALFNLIGTIYGGDGQTTFQLPNLQSRTVYGQGNSQSGTYTIGQTLGVEGVSLTPNQLPSHTHVVAAVAGPAVPNPSTSPANKVPSSQANQADPPYGVSTPDATMSTFAVSNTGGNQAHDNIQPVLAINFVIAVEGVFPSRN